MAPNSRFLVAVLVATLGVPSLASAQATRRSGGGQSGGGGSEARPSPSGPSQGGGSRVAVPRSSAPRERPAPAPSGGQSSRRPTAGEQRVTNSGAATAPGQSGRVATGSTRTRGARGIEGVAQPRSYSGGGYPGRPGYPAYPAHHYPYYGYGYPYHGYPYYGSVGFGYPWYCCGSFSFGVSVGFGWGAPYYGYPYGGWYGAGYWPYGPAYWPGPYAPVFVPVPYGVTIEGDQGGNQGGQPETREYSSAPPPTGSVRFRASPNSARVYVDGALAGTVDDFDGLGNHLRLEAGRHFVELRADGYEPYSTEILVPNGRTLTTRATLKPAR